jgi:hypothetical protein
LHRHIESGTILIDGPPQPARLVIMRGDDLTEMP